VTFAFFFSSSSCPSSVFFGGGGRTGHFLQHVYRACWMQTGTG
jgi:hypothetical protein